MLTFLPLTGLSLASNRVTVTVTVSSTDGDEVETEIVDLLAETAPAVKVTVAALVRLMLSVVSVAEMVLTSALVDLIVAVV